MRQNHTLTRSRSKTALLASAACAAAALVLGGASAAQANSIGVHYAGDQTADPYVLIGPTGATPVANSGQDAGVVDQYYWNNTPSQSVSAGGTLGSLIDSTGATTTMSLTWANYNENGVVANQVTAGQSYTGDQELYENVWRSTQSTQSLSISSVPYSQYTLYVYYGLFTQPRTGTITVSGTNLGVKATTVLSSQVENYQTATGFVNGDAGSVTNGNYIVITGMTDSSFTISSYGNQEIGVAGFQIVNTVPEPASLGLLAIGCLGLLSRRHKTKT